ncbi:unnamed protein product [Pleuronectes platessa]|uniref:Uncharacterized protein n=1 Tax=Pleuronectes platessa TaxID=8262 RepID=A0A9N7V544_PLEPL|nr:unnamed protein product [Pleuronectes platessa]
MIVPVFPLIAERGRMGHRERQPRETSHGHGCQRRDRVGIHREAEPRQGRLAALKKLLEHKAAQHSENHEDGVIFLMIKSSVSSNQPRDRPPLSSGGKLSGNMLEDF